MVITDPFFWALVSMFGMTLAVGAWGRPDQVAKFPVVLIIVSLVTIGRVALPLPFVIQPRFNIGPVQWVIGGIILVAGLIIGGGPTFTIKSLTPPTQDMELRTTGIYGIIRNPIYLSEQVWFTGLCILFGSIIGLCTVPLWWLVFWIHTLAEEKMLEDTLGDKYREYKNKVKGRMLPGLPL
jgi:protein-S-isoprenylcysteine O-methyltransferase Ste14